MKSPFEEHINYLLESAEKNGVKKESLLYNFSTGLDGRKLISQYTSKESKEKYLKIILWHRIQNIKETLPKGVIYQPEQIIEFMPIRLFLRLGDDDKNYAYLDFTTLNNKGIMTASGICAGSPLDGVECTMLESVIEEWSENLNIKDRDNYKLHIDKILDFYINGTPNYIYMKDRKEYFRKFEPNRKSVEPTILSK